MKKVVRVRSKSNKIVAKKRPIPAIFKPYLWSYDIKKMDLETNKRTVIEQVLDVGSLQASKLLLSLYPKSVVKNELQKIKVNPYNHKSVSFWYKMFNLGSLGKPPRLI